MFDLFLILTPLLILSIVALLRFIGCSIPDSGELPGPFFISPRDVLLGPGQTITFQVLSVAENALLPASEFGWSGATNGFLMAPYPWSQKNDNSPTVTLSASSSGPPIDSVTVVFAHAHVTIQSVPPLTSNEVHPGQTVGFQAIVTMVGPPLPLGKVLVSLGAVLVTWTATLGTLTTDSSHPDNSNVALYTPPAVTAQTTDTVSIKIDADPQPMGETSVTLTLLTS